MITSNPKTMQDLAKESHDKLAPFTTGDVIECTVISTSKNKVLLDVAGLSLGMVPEKEFSYDVDDLRPHDKVLGYVIMPENQDGYVILSLKRADKERVWTTLGEKIKSGEPTKVKIASANRGGLVVEFGGVEGFIPVSQLAEHQSLKSTGIDDNKPLNFLRGKVGSQMNVKVLTADKNTNKLIFSEKSIGNERLNDLANKITVGTRVDGKITGVVDYGLFVLVKEPISKEEVEGLVHISEISWDRVDKLVDRFKPSEQIKAVVLSNRDGRLSLSIKRLTPDPWSQIADKYKEGQLIIGLVSRVTPFGAFVKLESSIDGLVHISQLGDKVSDPAKVVQEGKEYEFTILTIDSKGRKISLTLLNKEKAQLEKKMNSKAEIKKAEKKISKPTAKKAKPALAKKNKTKK